MCPNQGLSPQPLGVQGDAPTNCTSQPGLYIKFLSLIDHPLDLISTRYATKNFTAFKLLKIINFLSRKMVPTCTSPGSVWAPNSSRLPWFRKHTHRRTHRFRFYQNCRRHTVHNVSFYDVSSLWCWITRYIFNWRLQMEIFYSFFMVKSFWRDRMAPHPKLVWMSRLVTPDPPRRNEQACCLHNGASGKGVKAGFLG